MVKQKKLAIFLPNMGGGGAERVALNLANSWITMGFDVDLVLLKAEGPLLDMLPPDIRVVDLQTSSLLNLVIKLANYLRRHQPDALLACMWPLTVIAVISRFIGHKKCRLVLAEHTTWSTAPLYKRKIPRLIIRLTMRLLFPRADHVLAVSKGATDDLEKIAMLPPGIISTMYNPVVGLAKPSVDTPTTPRGWCQGNHRRILAVGNLKGIKDFGTLLQAFEQLTRQGVNAHLLILGEGECRGALESQAVDLGISSRVHMFGFVADTSPYYRHAELFVLSSKGEGLPNVIIEALASGTPVVSTDCPSGPREILENGRYGRLVPVGNVEALSEAMLESLNSEHDTQILEKRAQDFTIDKISRSYLDLMLPGWEFKGIV